jgi:hypothetical protein
LFIELFILASGFRLGFAHFFASAEAKPRRRQKKAVQ